MSNEATIDMPKLQALLPSYINSTASANERLFVKDALSQSAQARAALAWHESLAEKVINDVEAVPADLGWTQLQAKVRSAAHANKAARGATSKAAKKWYQGIWQTMEPYMPHNWLPAPALGGVCAALLAVVVGQGFLMNQATQNSDYSQARGTQPAESSASTVSQGATDSKFVRLNFKDRVSERDMRLLLVRTGAVIVSGPGQLGDYTVAIPANELNQALKEFNDSLLTESAQAVASPAARSSDRSGTTGAAPGQASSQATP
jgi:hypothetical protein